MSFSSWLLGAGSLAALGAGVLQLVTAGRGFRGRAPGVMDRAALAGLLGTLLLLGWGLWVRWGEVNHFPAQTMYEVLSYACFHVVLSTALLTFILGLHRAERTGRAVGNALLGMVLAGTGILLRFWVRGLDPGPKDLPPALQSYWFWPHITALIFAYATLTVAYFAALVYFCLEFARGLQDGGVPPGKMLAIGAFCVAPYVLVVNLPVLVAVVAIRRWLRGRRTVALEGYLEGVDTFTFRIFSTGFPFLTAGLLMGALWAQEAWANYWGWDSKEVSAQISWLIYLVYLHLRWVAGWRGERGLWILLLGAASILITFQLFGYLPESVDSLHKYTEGGSQEGMLGTGLESPPR